MQFAAPRMTPVVKVILILCAAIFLLQLVCENFLGFSLSPLLGFMPGRLLDGWLWQPFTYAFLHGGLFHMLFNLLILWSIGCELEALWGTRTFLGYFFVCTLGGAFLYGLFALGGLGMGAMHPVVGSSGAVYGLLLAYGILFGDRMMYFFMLFPMPAKYFVLLLGGIELISSVFYSRDGVAHLAHLGGMAFGFLYLSAMASWKRRLKLGAKQDQIARERAKRLKKAGHLKLIRGEDEDDDDPKHWN